MKIIILVPHPTARGGVTNYYQSIKNYFGENIEYFYRGSSEWPYRKNIFQEFIRLVKDSLLFFQLLRNKSYSIVQTTTSFSLNSFLRDGVFLVIAKLFQLKTIVFFRGWDYEFTDKISSNKIYMFLLKKIFFRADVLIDLVKSNESKLRELGYTGRSYIETTLVDKNLVNGLSLSDIEKKYQTDCEQINLLYLGRIEIQKGVYEAVDAYRIVKKTYRNLNMTIAGDGKELGKLKQYISNNDIKDITFCGHVNGIEKKQCFQRAHYYIFPSYVEGMPSSVLEAMASGLPVITRTVGGLVDFFENKKHGFITSSKNSAEFAKYITKLIQDVELTRDIAKTNYSYANRFLAPVVAKRMEKIFFDLKRKEAN